MSPLRLLNRGVLRNGSTIHLKPRGPGALPSSHFSLIPAIHKLGFLVLRVFGLPLLFGPLLRTDLALLRKLNWPFLPQIRVGLQSDVSGRRGRRREAERNLCLGDIFGGLSLIPVGHQAF